MNQTYQPKAVSREGGEGGEVPLTIPALKSGVGCSPAPLPALSPKRVAAVDFDGVLCVDSKNIFADFAADRPPEVQPGAAEGLAWLRKNGYEIVIFTCRPYEHRRMMGAFLDRHELAHDYIVFHGKPRADVYIDDKALRFTTWPEVIAQLAPTSPVAFAAEPNTLFEEALKRERWRHIDLTGVRRVLDIGPGHAPCWPESFLEVDCVEPDFNARAQLRLRKQLRWIFTPMRKIEAFDLLKDYDLVTILGVLEHVEDPAAFLDQFAEARRIFLTVPNGASFHRHVGRMLGLLKDFDELGEADRRVGHRRYYTCDTLATEIGEFQRRHGFQLRLARMGSCSFKVADNGTMAALLGKPELVDALNRAALANEFTGDGRYRGAELYVELERLEGLPPSPNPEDSYSTGPK